MRTRHALPSLIALVALLALSAPAAAATVTLQPSPSEARTFATTNGGWSSTVDYGGLVCIPGVTCPTASGTFQSSGGSGGSGDGYLRASFGTLLGVLSTTTLAWTSPSFTAPASTDAATLTLQARPQIASLLAIGSVNLTTQLLDVTGPADTLTLGSMALTTASSSFRPIEIPVDASAIVPGHTYQLRILTATTTNVSAVTSGNVAYDDVELRLTDLQLPTDLTADVPATGALRVEGAVDPQGQSTDVTVDYGPDSGYGSSSAPATVSGSGSQPFTVPLAGLVAGATYHYRVRAVNADGSAATSDATFVAPTPPTSAAPTVDGLGNSRLRIVTFARTADVVGADVELLDAADAVLDTVADDDADGLVVVTLPDADGDYAIRVVRRSDRELTSASAAVPATLDRVAPDPGGPPHVTGGPDHYTVTFVRDPETTTAAIELLDADDVLLDGVNVPVGGSGSIVLPDAPGDYAIRVVQIDAAGNGAASPSTLVTRPAPTGPAAPAGPPAAAPPAPPAAQRPVVDLADPGGFGSLLARCYGAPDLAITDVRVDGRRALLTGLTRLAPGTAIAVVDRLGRTVAHTTTDGRGGFRATVPLPAAAHRPDARYTAIVGATRSVPVPLLRANALRSVRVRAGVVSLRGRVDVARLGPTVRFTVLGGRGASACLRPAAPLPLLGAPRFDRRSGTYLLRVKAPAGGGRLAVDTLATGRTTGRSGFFLR